MGAETGAETRDTEEGEEELPPDMPPMEAKEVRAVEEILDYRFRNKRLLEEALTHGSFYFPSKKCGPCYERLEFVGDSVLGCLMAREVFTSYADLPPDQLTLLRDANVDTERLSRVAVSSGLHHYLRHKAPQLQGQIQEFMEGMDEYPIHLNALVDPPEELADIVESVIGAIFMDSNSSLEIVWTVQILFSTILLSVTNSTSHSLTSAFNSAGV